MSQYINRELSYLAFNRRIVEIAAAEDTPIQEKLRFLTILASNLDEFFMVRVSSIRKMLKKGEECCDSPDGMSNRDLLANIRQEVEALMAQARQIATTEIFPQLAKENVGLKPYAALNAEQKRYLRAYFCDNILPVLTPLAFDSSHPFPYLGNQSACLMVTLGKCGSDCDYNKVPFGFVEIPANIEQLVVIAPNSHWYVCLIELIQAHLEEVFVGCEVDAAWFMRVTRDWDYELVEDEVLDLLTTMQMEIAQEHRDAVRLEVDRALPAPLLNELRNNLRLEDRDIYQIEVPFMLGALIPLLDVPLEQHRYPPFNPRLPRRLVNNRNIFALIANGDLLVHHPYESFYTVLEFLNEAAHDEQTLAIKQTLYRTGGASPLIDILIAAAENGKKVTVIVELKARFDEKSNIKWAQRLEKAGVSVVYGFIHVKTHLKATIVVRREEGQTVQYVHLSTGNYNPRTARTYTDIGLFTAQPDYGRDVALLFNILTGYHLLWNESEGMQNTASPQFRKLAVAPFNMRAKIIALIKQEVASHRRHKNGMIIAKMNALVDKEIIDHLYNASQAGVEIKLIVRGICCLQAQQKGLSDNIEVTSTVGRFLEHSRIFYFYANGEKKVFLSSGDWMPRNMDRRIEVMYPVLDKRLKEQITEFILPIYVNDADAWHQRKDGTYAQKKRRSKRQGAHDLLIAYARESGIKSIPYELAIRRTAQARKKKTPRPVAT